MVSSYLVCDTCGRFGPPAGFLKREDGLRLCYQCWVQEWQENHPASPETEIGPDEPPATDAGESHHPKAY